MKITVEDSGKIDHNKITVESKFDDLSIDQVYEDLVEPALIAYGFSEKIVRRNDELD